MPLKPRVSFQVASGVPVTVYHVATAVAREGPILQRQAIVPRVADTAPPARQPPVRHHDHRGRRRHCVRKLPSDRSDQLAMATPTLDVQGLQAVGFSPALSCRLHSARVPFQVKRATPAARVNG